MAIRTMESSMKFSLFFLAISLISSTITQPVSSTGLFVVGPGVVATHNPLPDILSDETSRSGQRRRNAALSFIAAHNGPRGLVHVPPLVWNATLAEYARRYAARRAVDCEMLHSEGPYGENLAAGSWSMTAKQAVALWIDEKKAFLGDRLACMASGECLHYTQVVWNTTKSVGCAKAKCSNGWMFVTCNYFPPGNYVGELPY